MANEIRTKYGHTAKDIAQDFAEQLKYSLRSLDFQSS